MQKKSQQIPLFPNAIGRCRIPSLVTVFHWVPTQRDSHEIVSEPRISRRIQILLQREKDVLYKHPAISIDDDENQQKADIRGEELLEVDDDKEESAKA